MEIVEEFVKNVSEVKNGSVWEFEDRVPSSTPGCPALLTLNGEPQWVNVLSGETLKVTSDPYFVPRDRTYHSRWDVKCEFRGKKTSLPLRMFKTSFFDPGIRLGIKQSLRTDCAFCGCELADDELSAGVCNCCR